MTPKVTRTPRTTKSIRMKADKKEVITDADSETTKNIVIIAIKVGKRPLHGTKLFVSMARRRSLGESIIRQPTTPAALHPNPIAIQSACFPHA